MTTFACILLSSETSLHVLLQERRKTNKGKVVGLVTWNFTTDRQPIEQYVLGIHPGTLNCASSNLLWAHLFLHQAASIGSTSSPKQLRCTLET
mmetsp:Transcript_34865/g.93092  ORF Transcript_34865/g.93092 Transcript_34865/m.93092 type:complete len:93 (-) Transcript_34865:337-615(-)